MTEHSAEPVAVEPAFVGRSRHALVDGLLACFDEVNCNAVPQ